MLTCIDTVGELADAHLFELHEIARERASLIREDIVDLTQLFIEVTRLHLRGQCLIDVIDFCIPLNELSLEKFHHLHSHYQ